MNFWAGNRAVVRHCFDDLAWFYLPINLLDRDVKDLGAIGFDDRLKKLTAFFAHSRGGESLGTYLHALVHFLPISKSM